MPRPLVILCLLTLWGACSKEQLLPDTVRPLERATQAVAALNGLTRTLQSSLLQTATAAPGFFAGPGLPAAPALSCPDTTYTVFSGGTQLLEVDFGAQCQLSNGASVGGFFDIINYSPGSILAADDNAPAFLRFDTLRINNRTVTTRLGPDQNYTKLISRQLFAPYTFGFKRSQGGGYNVGFADGSSAMLTVTSSDSAFLQLTTPELPDLASFQNLYTLPFRVHLADPPPTPSSGAYQDNNMRLFRADGTEYANLDINTEVDLDLSFACQYFTAGTLHLTEGLQINADVLRYTVEFGLDATGAPVPPGSACNDYRFMRVCDYAGGTPNCYTLLQQ